MMWTKHKRWCGAVAGGWLLGAMLCHAVGIYIRSDNLPFFAVLGASLGLAVGCALFWWTATRS